MSLKLSFKQTQIAIYTGAALSFGFGLAALPFMLPNAREEYAAIDQQPLRTQCRSGLAEQERNLLHNVSYEYSPRISPQMVENCMSSELDKAWKWALAKSAALPLGALLLSSALIRAGSYNSGRRKKHTPAIQPLSGLPFRHLFRHNILTR